MDTCSLASGQRSPMRKMMVIYLEECKTITAMDSDSETPSQAE